MTRNHPNSAWLRDRLERALVPIPDPTSLSLDIHALGPRKMRINWSVPERFRTRFFLRLGIPPDSPVDCLLRFLDVTDTEGAYPPPNHVFDIPVIFSDNGHTATFWAADREYIAELIWRTPHNGKTMALARSNRVRLPREEPGSSPLAADVPLPGFGATPFRPPAKFIDIETEQARFDGLNLESSDDPDALSTVRAVYRAFLTTGRRALRLAPPLAYRDPAERARLASPRQRMHGMARAAIAASERPVYWWRRLDTAADVSPHRLDAPSLSTHSAALNFPPVCLTAMASAGEFHVGKQRPFSHWGGTC